MLIHKDTTSGFAQYYKEKQGSEILVAEEAFISFQDREDHIHIHEIFVPKNKRLEGHGRALLDAVKKEAKTRGKKFVTCNCDLSANNPEDSLVSILKAFKVVPKQVEIEFYMEIE